MSRPINLDLPCGHYVVAVSGGVDSVSLLDMLSRNPHMKLTVAHFDHGIRSDSSEDLRLVRQLAEKYKLPFVYEKGELGPGASEETARRARYSFLKKVKDASGAQGIVTAHHQDDQIETVILNMFRGTGRKGLSPLYDTAGIFRPLLHLTKDRLYEYAKNRNLNWREDSTNQNVNYRRNYIRHHIIHRISPEDRFKLITLISNTRKINREIDQIIDEWLKNNATKKTIDRTAFIQLPHKVSKEIMASWLRRNDIRQFDTKLLERLVIAAKTFKNGQMTDINSGYLLKVSNQKLALEARDR